MPTPLSKPSKKVTLRLFLEDITWLKKFHQGEINTLVRGLVAEFVQRARALRGKKK